MALCSRPLAECYPGEESGERNMLE